MEVEDRDQSEVAAAVGSALPASARIASERGGYALSVVLTASEDEVRL